MNIDQQKKEFEQWLEDTKAPQNMDSVSTMIRGCMFRAWLGARGLDSTPVVAACIVCGKPFEVGDTISAFLRCPEDPRGSWTGPYPVDAGFQERHARNADKIKRRHGECIPETET